MDSAPPTGPGTERGLIWLREEPCSRNPAHSRARIATAALALADSEGFEAVSMRRVAQELGAGTMTLYHYVDNKDELVALMMDSVMGEMLVPEDELSGNWREAMEQIAKRSYAAFANHRWTLDRLGDMRPGPNGMRHFEQSLKAMSGAGLSVRAQLEAIVQVDEYIYGFAIREAQERDKHEQGRDACRREFFQRELGSGNFPLIGEMLGADADAAFDRVADVLHEEGRFERGLGRLLDGISAQLRS